VNSTGLGDVARHCFSPPARRPPGAKTTFKDVDGPFHETAFVGDTHTHTCTGHMRGHATSTARSLVFMPKRRFPTRKSRRTRFIARGSIRVITRLRYSIKTKKNLRAASFLAVHQQIEVSIVFVSSLVSFPVPVEYSVVLALRSFLSDVHCFARAAHHELIVEQQPPVNKTRRQSNFPCGYKNKLTVG
jgi:hypothetical protein